MSKGIWSATLLLSGLLLTVGLAAEESGGGSDDLSVFLDEGKVSLDFRYRYEFVEDDGFDNDARASTLRTRLGFQSGVWRGWDFNIEVNDVRHVLSNNFDSGGGSTPERTGVFPVVADPKGTRLNQGYINYTGLDDWGFKVGRQRINLDNQRFVSSVVWRQTEQVFDAGTAAWGNDKAAASLTYVQWVRRIFGPNAPAGKQRQDPTVLLNGGIDTRIGRLVGYYYHIENQDQASFSSGSVGVRLTGNPELNERWRLRYEAEYAHQRDVGNNPLDYSADYLHLVAAAQIGVFDFGLGWELLGGDDDTLGNAAFQTPLALLHGFNGWADVFLTTPANGLSDVHLTFQAKPGKALFQARYHDFRADAGSDSYGTELDLLASYQFTKRFQGLLKMAVFDGRQNPGTPNSFNDVTKFWVQFYFKL